MVASESEKTDRRRREDDEGDGAHAWLIYISTRFRGLHQGKGKRLALTVKTTRASPDHPGHSLPPAGTPPTHLSYPEWQCAFLFQLLGSPPRMPKLCPPYQPSGGALLSLVLHRQPRSVHPAAYTQTPSLIVPAEPANSEPRRLQHMYRSRRFCTAW